MLANRIFQKSYFSFQKVKKCLFLRNFSLANTDWFENIVMLEGVSPEKQDKSKFEGEVLEKHEQPSIPEHCNCNNSSSNSRCSISVLQSKRAFRKQGSIINTRQTTLLQVPIVGNSSTSSYQSSLNPCTIYQRQNLFFPVFAYTPLNAQRYLFPMFPTSQQTLYSTYFHRTENRDTPPGSGGSHVVAIEDAGHNHNQVYLESLRKWQATLKVQTPTKPGTHFTVMCYNVLAQDLIREHPNLYKYHDQNALKWKVRWNNILNEIKKLNPDILCLQEVQESHLESHFKTLEALGYNVIYKKRTGYRIDGCAIYYKKNTMRLVDFTTLEYYQEYVNVLNRDNIAIIARFAPIGKQTEFVVSTTHLLYNPKRQDVRVAQVQLLLAEIDLMAYNQNSGSHGSYVPTIITGDLNSKFNSALYKLLIKGKLKYEKLAPRSLVKTDSPTTTGKVLIPPHLRITDQCQHVEVVKLRRKTSDVSREDTMKLVHLQHSERETADPRKSYYNDSLFSTGTLTHNFPLKSVYSHRSNDDVEATTYQDEWTTVDYIFYSGRKEGDIVLEDKLKLLSRYRLPVSSELTGVRIPNSTLGSDHLSLIGRFFLED